VSPEATHRLQSERVLIASGASRAFVWMDVPRPVHRAADHLP